MWGVHLVPNDFPLSGNDLEQMGGLPKSHMCYRSLTPTGHSWLALWWILDPNWANQSLSPECLTLRIENLGVPGVESHYYP